MKNWYIIEDKAHLGPYTARNIISLYEQGKIFDDTEIWKEGMDAPTTYKKEFIDSLQDLMKEETSTPVSPIPQESTSDLKKNINIDQDKILVFEKNKNQQNKKVEQEEIKEFRPEIPRTKSRFEKAEKSSTDYLKYILMFFGAVMIGVSILTGVDYYRFKKVFSKPKDLEGSHYQRLLAAQKTSTHLTFDLALSKDHTKIFVATNWTNQGKIKLRFKSLQGKILSDEEIEFEATGKLENYLAVLNNIRFKKGLKIVDGFYETQIISVGDSKKSPLLWFLPKTNNKINYNSTYFLSAMNKDDVLSIITSKENKERDQIKNYLNELEQTLLTLRSLYIETNTKFNSVLAANAKEFHLAYKNFEFFYTTNPGQMFTQFLITNENNLKTYRMLKHVKAEELTLVTNEINKNMQEFGKMVTKYMNLVKTSKPTQFPLIKNDYLADASLLLGDCELTLKRVQDEKNRL